MPNETMDAELVKIRAWANDQLAHGKDEPWSSFLLTRLSETIDALLAGRAATRTLDAQKGHGSELGLRLVASNTPRSARNASAVSARDRTLEPAGTEGAPAKRTAARIIEPVA
jgi:hypothetical protein